MTMNSLNRRNSVEIVVLQHFLWSLFDLLAPEIINNNNHFYYYYYCSYYFFFFTFFILFAYFLTQTILPYMFLKKKL